MYLKADINAVSITVSEEKPIEPVPGKPAGGAEHTVEQANDITDETSLSSCTEF
jgi:hypothetical protein